jgi:hypothetical protein
LLKIVDNYNNIGSTILFYAVWKELSYFTILFYCQL